MDFGFCPENQIKYVSLCVINRKTLQNTLSPGAVAQVQGWEIGAGAESAKMLAQTSAGGSSSRRTQPGKIFLVMRTLPASQPALTAAAAATAKSAKILAVLHCAASKGCIGLEKKLSVYF